MPEKDLTAAQRATLLLLMIKAGELPNTFLAKTGKISLKESYRQDLARRGLITVTEKPLVLILTEKGWGKAIEEFGAVPPPRAGALGGTLYVLLDFISQYLRQHELSAAEFFTAVGPEERVRRAYDELAPRRGEYIMLDRLRSAVPDIPKANVDAALLRLDRQPNVHLVPESNQKVLTPAQRAAAIKIGNQKMHLIAIGS